MDQAISPTTITRRRRLRVAVAVALLATVCAAAWGINHAVRPSVAIGELMLGEVRRGDIANTIGASGVVIPVHEELVSSPLETRVTRVHAKLGQQVAAGELLLELDNRTVTLAIDSLQEQLAQQENRILGLTLELDQKRKQLVSAIELLKLDLQSTQVKFSHYTELRKSGAVSGEDMLTAELNVKRAEIQLRQQHEQIDDNARVTNSAIVGARLQKAILQKQLAEQQKLLDQTRVKAPFAGMLTSLLADEGASVAPGQLVARVSELNNYQVEASLSDFYARSLNPDQAVRIDQGGQTLAGRVHTILPEIQNGTIKLIVALDQPHHPMLRNKMRVDVSIVTDSRSGALVTDAGPAFNGKGRQSLFIVRDGVARRSTLDIGAGDGKRVEILSGAAAGDRIIISDTTRYQGVDNIRIAN